MTRGTARHDATALATAAESLGGTLASDAGWHASDVSITVSTARLDEALALVAETVRQPTFAPSELDRVRTQMLDELKVAFTQPATLASLAAERLLFGRGPYGHPVGGTPATLRRIKRADVLALHAARYRPDNAVLVLAGDLDAEAALRLARRHFGAWKRPGDPAPTALPAGVATRSGLPSTAAIIDMPGAGQAAVVQAMALPVLGEERAAAQVTNAVLGGGYSSRLNQEVRVKRGLSYAAGSQLDARRAGGALFTVVQTKNESAAEVVALMQRELDRLIAEPVGADELDARKAALIGGFSRNVETTAGLAATLKALVVSGRAPAELRTRIAAFEAVSAAAVQNFAAAHLKPAQRRVVVAGEAGRFANALKADVPGIVTVPARALDLERGDTLESTATRPPR